MGFHIGYTSNVNKLRSKPGKAKWMPVLLLPILFLAAMVFIAVQTRQESNRSIRLLNELNDLFVPGTDSISTSALDRLVNDKQLGGHPGIPLRYRIPEDMSEQEFEEIARLILKDYLSGVDVAMGSLDENDQYIQSGYTEPQPYGDPRQSEFYISVASETDLQDEPYPELPSESLLDYLANDGFKVRPGPEVRSLSTWSEYVEGDQPYYALLTLWGIERAGKDGYKAVLIFRTPDYMQQLMVDISPPAAAGNRQRHWEQFTLGCG